MRTAGKTKTLVDVLVPFPVDRAFTYEVPEGADVAKGTLVKISFRRRSCIGIVWGEAAQVPEKCLALDEALSYPPLQPTLCAFIEWVAAYTLTPLGLIGKMVLSGILSNKPADVFGYRLGSIDDTTSLSSAANRVVLALDGAEKPLRQSELLEMASVSRSVLTTLERKGIVERVNLSTWEESPSCFTLPALALTPAQEACAQDMRRVTGHQVFVLDGVTGSGKTEVYFDVMASHLKQGHQVMVLVPEIGLSQAWWARFKRHFGAVPDMWHSDMSEGQRHHVWERVATGKAQVVIGARSALFLPFKRLGLIVVDEEHDSSFKQEEGVVYNARDMAVVRARLEDIPVILASATPSLETVENCRQGRYTHLSLPYRYGEFQPATVHLVDMRSQEKVSRSWLSKPLKTAIHQTLERNEQTLLFLNRRGYAPVTVCQGCGHRFACSACSAWLVAHGVATPKARLACHHCGHVEPWPAECPACGAEDALIPCGPGVERIAEEVARVFPDARVLVMSSDAISTPTLIKASLAKIENEEVDIIIGTQIMTKGYDFGKLTCVGVIDGDLGLMGGDLRASEKAFQVLHQVAGRAGRHRPQAHVFIQTFDPDHPLMQALCNGQREAFVEQELHERSRFHWPPFGRLAALIFSGVDGAMVEKAARWAVQRAPQVEGVRLLGPAPAPLHKLRGKVRWRILVKTSREIRLQPFLKQWLQQFPKTSLVRVQVDIDPLTFL